MTKQTEQILFYVVNYNITSTYIIIEIIENNKGVSIPYLLNSTLFNYKNTKQARYKLEEIILNDLNKRIAKGYIKIVILNKQTLNDINELFPLNYIDEIDNIELFKYVEIDVNTKYFLGIEDFKIDNKDVNYYPKKIKSIEDMGKYLKYHNKGYKLNDFI